MGELFPPTRAPGGNFRIVGVDEEYDGTGGVSADATTDFIVDAANELIYQPVAPLGAGGQYRVRAGYTQSNMLGTLSYNVPVEIGRGVLAAADRIAAGDLSADVVVAPTYSGVFHSVSPQSPDVVDLQLDALRGVPTDARIRARTSANNNTVSYFLRAALGGELAADATAEIIESGALNFFSEIVTVALRVSALAEVDPIQIAAPFARAEVRNNAQITDVGTGFYDTGTQFALGQGSDPGFRVAGGGQVLVSPTDLNGGSYQVFVDATSDSGKFLGTVRFEINFEVAADNQNPNWGILSGDLTPGEIAVSPSYAGSIYAVSPRDKTRVDLHPQAPSDPRVVAAQADGGDTALFSLAAALGGGVAITVTTSVREDAGQNYNPIYQSVVLQVRARDNPPDRSLSFAATDAAIGANQNLTDFGDTAPYNANVSFARDDALSSAELVVDAGGQVRVGAAALGAGTYNLRANATSTNNAYLGGVPFNLQVQVTVVPFPEGDGRGIPAAERVDAGSPTVAVAPGYDGDVRTFALSGADVNIDNVPLVVNGVEAAQVARDVVLRIQNPLSSQENRSPLFDLVENTGAEYATRTTRIGVHLRGTDTGDVSRVRSTNNGANPIPTSAEIVDLKTKDPAYALAEFGEHGTSNDLNVDANGVVNPQLQLNAGNYGITVTAIAPATSPNDFLGTATIVVNLEVTDQQLVADADSIPQGERVVATVVAPGYAGEVASFRAVVNNVNLETPSTTPPGLVFPTGEVFPGGLPSDPNSRAIGVSLAAGIQPGETRIQTFEVTAKQTGRADTPIELMVSVYAIALPPHPEFETDTGSAIATTNNIQFTPPVGHPGGLHRRCDCLRKRHRRPQPSDCGFARRGSHDADRAGRRRRGGGCCAGGLSRGRD